MSENSYLRHFSAQVSQIVFLAYLTVLRLITTIWVEMQKTHLSSISVHKYNKSCSQLVWPFYHFLQLFQWKSQKTRNSAILVHKYHNSCSYLIWQFYGLLELY